jgi:hypothetical protein
MREIDRLECEAMGRTAKRALRLGLMASDEVWTAKSDGRPEAMFGRVVTSALGGKATPWFLGTDEVYRHGRLLMRLGREVVGHWRDSTPNMENVVSAANDRAIRLLRYWGFSVGSETRMIGGQPFLHFSMEG